MCTVGGLKPYEVPTGPESQQELSIGSTYNIQVLDIYDSRIHMDIRQLRLHDILLM